MGIWRNDPQPQQRGPFLPPSAYATGSQPPRSMVAGVVALACALSSHPAAGEPRPIQPLQGRSQIAPLTLKYGQQPPTTAFITTPELAALRATWEPLAPMPPVPLKFTASGVVIAAPYIAPPRLTLAELASWVAPPTIVLLPPRVTAGSVDAATPYTRALDGSAWVSPTALVPRTTIGAVVPVPVIGSVPYTRALELSAWLAAQGSILSAARITAGGVSIVPPYTRPPLLWFPLDGPLPQEEAGAAPLIPPPVVSAFVAWTRPTAPWIDAAPLQLLSVRAPVPTTIVVARPFVRVLDTSAFLETRLPIVGRSTAPIRPAPFLSYVRALDLSPWLPIARPVWARIVVPMPGTLIVPMAFDGTISAAPLYDGTLMSSAQYDGAFAAGLQFDGQFASAPELDGAFAIVVLLDGRLTIYPA